METICSKRILLSNELLFIRKMSPPFFFLLLFPLVEYLFLTLFLFLILKISDSLMEFYPLTLCKKESHVFEILTSSFEI